jgi:hypothetical protein
MNSPKKASKPTPEATTQAKSTARQRRFKVVKLEERIAPRIGLNSYNTHTDCTCVR